MMMELNRISSHLVAPGDRWHGARRAHRDDLRLPRARDDPRPLRADHRPAHEQRLRPPGRRRAGPAAGRRRPDRRRRHPAAQELQGHRVAARRQRHLDGPHRGRRLPRPHRLHGARHHRPDACARPACRGTCARRSRTAATRPTTSTSSTADHVRRLRPLPHPARRDGRVAQDRRAVPRPAAPRPGHGRGQEDRLAGAARDRRRRPRQLPRPHPRTSWASRWRP